MADQTSITLLSFVDEPLFTITASMRGYRIRFNSAMMYYLTAEQIIGLIRNAVRGGVEMAIEGMKVNDLLRVYMVGDELEFGWIQIRNWNLDLWMMVHFTLGAGATGVEVRGEIGEIAIEREELVRTNF
jgi:hypothetical protein